MNKKILVSLSVIFFTIFSFTICFANTDGLESAANDVRNFVGGVENTVEDAARDVSNTSKNVTGSVENEMDKKLTTNNASDGNYTSMRTTTNDTVMGMTSTAWTWLIIGIAAIAIIAVVWYYSMQFTNNNHSNDD